MHLALYINYIFMCEYVKVCMYLYAYIIFKMKVKLSL
jgi:hypothetical protein